MIQIKKLITFEKTWFTLFTVGVTFFFKYAYKEVLSSYFLMQRIAH